MQGNGDLSGLWKRDVHGLQGIGASKDLARGAAEGYLALVENVDGVGEIDDIIEAAGSVDDSELVEVFEPHDEIEEFTAATRVQDGRWVVWGEDYGLEVVWFGGGDTALLAVAE